MNSGGPRAGSSSQGFFTQFPLIFQDFRPRYGDFPNYKQFAALLQKRLDKPRASAYNWRAAGSFLHIAFALAQEDLLNLKKFCPNPQKRLDMRRFCTYSGAGTSLFHFAFALYGAAGVDPVGSDPIKVDPTRWIPALSA
jgi:hypothetical protein